MRDNYRDIAPKTLKKVLKQPSRGGRLAFKGEWRGEIVMFNSNKHAFFMDIKRDYAKNGSYEQIR